jgi:glucuronoarabinoxylan endo-1,4-beta-xylanase
MLAGFRIVVLVTIAMGVVVAAATGHAATAQIDAAVTHQLIRGFGGATVFMPETPLAGPDLDTLFRNGPGQLGFTWLRIRVASDDAWRAVELANARGAVARGAKVIATPWSPPAAMKTNDNLVAGALKTSAYADYATYLNDFARYMANNGAPLYAVSVQNEPDIAVTYESCDWTAAQLLDFCKNYAGAITATKIIMPESFQFRHALSDPVLNDPAAAENIDVVGGHIYGGGLAPYPLAAAKGKEVWMTEHLDLSTDWAGALATGKEIHDCLATADFSAYVWWYLRRYYGPLGEDSVVTKRGWVMAQFSKFIRPGFMRVDATAAPAAGISVSAYRRDKLVIVALNENPTAVTQTFAVANASLAAVTPWVTSGSVNLEQQPAIAVTAGSFAATLPAQSVTTFVADPVLPAPVIMADPQDHAVAAGSTVVFDVRHTGEYVTYQWKRAGVAIPGGTDRLLTLKNVNPVDAGAYAVTITNSGGSVTSADAILTVKTPTAPTQLINISMRSPVGTGDNVQIAGFVIEGSGTKQVLIRAAGPALGSSFGLTGVLTDPVIEVHDRTSVIASNDDWEPSLKPIFDAVSAFGWQTGSKDAAVVVPLGPGLYSAVVRGQNGGTGLAIVEVYDAGGPSSARIVNLSARSAVGTGDNLQIGGFVLSGDVDRTVVLRATGPTLHKAFRMSGTLVDPVIELHRQGDARILATSDDWPADLAPHFDAVGAFGWPAESRDAAIVVTLQPGAYSILVRGKADTTGVALVEVYAEP